MDVARIPAPPASSPWISIWLSPRRTIRYIVDASEPPSFWPVVLLAMLSEAFAALKFDDAGAIDWSASSMPVVLSGFGMGLRVQAAPVFLAAIGKWFGGQGKVSEIQHSIAWSLVPSAIGGLTMILAVLIYGDIEKEESITLAVMLLLGLVGVFWTFVTQVITLAEVQRFSIIRAIVCVFILFSPLLLLLYAVSRGMAG